VPVLSREPRATRTMELTAGAGLAGPRRWPAGLAWTLWALAMLALAAVPWFDRLLRQAGRPDLTQWDARPAVALVSAVTVGAVLASRRPRHPVGWLLLCLALSLIATGGLRSIWSAGCWSVPGRCQPPTTRLCITPPASSRRSP
jgi:hypothetical protein